MEKTRRVGCLGIYSTTLIFVAACTESGTSRSQNLESSSSIVGLWQNEDQLMILDSVDGEPIDIVVGFDLSVPDEVAAAEQKHGKEI